MAEELPKMPDASAPVGNTPAVSVSAASIVGEDTDTFSGAGSATNPPPIASASPAGPGTPPVTEPMKRGRGRPPGSKNKAAGAPGGSPSFDDVPKEPPPAPVDYKAMATMIFKITSGTMAQVLGPEWLPRQPPPGLPGEEEMVIEATANYMKTKQMPDIPPGAMLCLVILMYSAPRFQAPSTKEKVKGVWFWIKSKFGRKKKNFVSSENTREPSKEEKKEEKPDPRTKDNIDAKGPIPPGGEKVPTVGDRPEDWDKV